MKSQDQEPFPIESLFSGAHAAVPGLAEAEAERFLACGAKPAGFDLNSDEGKELLAHKPFISFQVAPLPPEIVARLAKLPPDWDLSPEGEREGLSIEQAVEKHYDLPPNLSAAIWEDNEVWIIPR